jgi:putative Holliday junction resolvase
MMADMRGRVLAVDHGEKRIGLAISDESRTIASPFGVLQHISRTLDAARVADTARERDARVIVIGQSLDEEGIPNAAGRSAGRFAEALRAQTEVPVILWDESLTTEDARALRRATGAPRKKRGGHLDDLAAAVLLQSYLDAGPLQLPPDTGHLLDRGAPRGGETEGGK